MIVLSGAALVLPDRILSPGTIVVEDGRIAEIRAGDSSVPAHPFHGHYIVPGFIDVHVHGVDGFDGLGGPDAVRSIASRMPRYGVTAFCPTTSACSPRELRSLLDQVRQAREAPDPRAARVLPAHLESNFINARWRGAQPLECLRVPREALEGSPHTSTETGHQVPEGAFGGGEILQEIERAAPDVGIVTIAPELDGGIDLVRWLTARGHRVSIGHSGATYDEALEAIAAGARGATHLFNRMPPLDHRTPGAVGAILQAEEVAAELICDGFHVHPALVRIAAASKRPARILAITDGTAAAGLPIGSRASLGGRPITAEESAAYLDDRTIAGSVATMDRVFRQLIGPIALSPVDAAMMCATTPARELGLVGHGVIAEGAVADLLVLDAQMTVTQTYVGGQLVYSKISG